MDRLTAMLVFTEVARSGSFSLSAKKLAMSRAMVTRHIDVLESWLGARILQRTTRHVSITQAGEALLQHSRHLLSLVEQIEEESASQKHELRGQLKLTCGVALGQTHVAAILTKFVSQHPHLKIDLSASDDVVNLIEERIDIAIRVSNTPDPMLVARSLAVCDSVLVASPGYLEQFGLPQQPQDLLEHRCLSYANFGKCVWHLTRAEQHVEIAICSYLSSNETSVVLRYALEGGGIAMQPTFLVNEYLKQGKLSLVLPDWHPPSMHIYALYPSRRHLSPAVRALLDFLVLQFAQPAW
ncbi:LysR family transcriptional regulator [Undibacterium flavidum]|uniref:LysR family transcriptional regulator n=1 Tax=Undibacterium flavidum TaxID=2762297 RepID=A0ABR6Y8P7_9BURK|nr:LysR family transcriptional regulator [Undibacterium flavidum]MBC3872998.1 LysR family transcriptional regulator [Undibacterium flavidum]